MTCCLLLKGVRIALAAFRTDRLICGARNYHAKLEHRTPSPEHGVPHALVALHGKQIFASIRSTNRGQLIYALVGAAIENYILVDFTCTGKNDDLLIYKYDPKIYGRRFDNFVKIYNENNMK